MIALSQTPSSEQHQNLEELDWEMEEAEGQPYLPSPWEIQRLCSEIRRNWSEAEYRKRAGHRVEPLEIATTPCRILLSDLSSVDFS